MTAGVLTIPLLDLEVPTEIVILGAITGLIYGLLAVGLALVYRSARFFNFAHTEIGTLTLGVMLYLHGFLEWPYWLSMFVAFVAAVVLGFLIDFIVIRRLTNAPRLVLIVATIGLAQVLLSLYNFMLGVGIDQPSERAQLIGNRLLSFPTPFEVSIDIGQLRLGAAHVMIVIVVPVLVLALTVFLKRSKIGLATRAAAENMEAASLAGVNPRLVSTTVWVLVAVISTASAILLAPTRPLNVGTAASMAAITGGVGAASTSATLLLRALGAAVLGGMTSLPQVFGAGVAVGVVEALVLWNYPNAGLVELVLLGMIIVAILVRKDLGRTLRGADDSSWSLGGIVHALEHRIVRRPRVRVAKWAFFAALVASVAWVSTVVNLEQRIFMSSVALFALMGLSLTILTGLAGQVSLGQFAFVGLGAVMGGRLVFSEQYVAGVEVPLVLLIGGGTALLIGLPALRLKGLLLAVTTLAFSLAGGAWLLRQDWAVVTTGAGTSLSLPRRTIAGVDLRSEQTYFYLCLAFLVLGTLLVGHLRQVGFGRRLVAVRDNEAGAATLAIPPRRVKLQGFVLAGVVATLAGYLYGGLLVNFSREPLFAVSRSLDLVVMVVFGGVTTVTGAILGALWVRGIPYFTNDVIGLLSSGLGVLVVLQVLPGGAASLAFRLRDKIVSTLVGEDVNALQVSDRALGVARAPLPAAPDRDTTGLPVPIRAAGVTVRFGGLAAVRDVTIEARHGEIVGLIGPNGAGKTTLFDVLTGQVTPSAGRVHLHGRDVTRMRPEKRAKLGMGRSFQQARLFPEVSLHDTFKLALEREQPTWALPSMLGLPPSPWAERRKTVRAEEIIDILGLSPYAGRNCGELSTGTRRFAELGCLLAMGCDVLLLDEPTAGIAQREVEAFTPVLREIRAHLGATMIVIDHDIPMMMSLVDRIYVMALGEVLAEGDPDAIRSDPAVIDAYLGTDERVIQRSGAAAGPSPERGEP